MADDAAPARPQEPAPTPPSHEKSTWAPRTPIDQAAVAAERFGTRFRVILLYILLGALAYGFFAPMLPTILSPLGLVLTAVAVVPVILVLFLVRKYEKLAPAQWELVIRIFLVSALIGSLAAFTNDRLGYLPPVLLYPLVVGPGEEAVKLAAVAVVAWRSPHFRGPLDGLLFGLASGAGFAAMENIAYVINQGISGGFEAGLSLAVTRLIVSIPGHMLWSATAGYFLGVAKLVPEQRRVLVVKGLLIAAATHGLYNIFATYAASAILIIGLAMHAGIGYYLAMKVKWQRGSLAAPAAAADS